LKLILKPEVFVSELPGRLPEVPIEIQQRAASWKKEMAKQPIDQSDKGDITFVDRQFKKDLDKSKKNLTCGGIRAKATNGIYSGATAANYAKAHYSNPNSSFAYYPNDCTNFASQNVLHGGIQMDGRYTRTDWSQVDLDSSWYSSKWENLFFNSISVSKSFRHVGTFMSHMYSYERTSYWYDFRFDGGYAMFDWLGTGDLLFIDNEGDGTFDHATTITGWEFVNGHWEPLLTYHSNNTLNGKFAKFKNAYPNGVFKGIHMYSPVV
jgi:hypothetical protein